MKEPCDNCGEIKEICYRWKYDVFDGFEMGFCYECGDKITEIIREGVAKK